MAQAKRNWVPIFQTFYAESSLHQTFSADTRKLNIFSPFSESLASALACSEIPHSLGPSQKQKF